jgi:hypothetical protein
MCIYVAPPPRPTNLIHIYTPSRHMEVERVLFGLTFVTPARLLFLSAFTGLAGAVLTVYARSIRRRF